MKIYKLSRRIKHRRQMLKNLATSCIIYERVKTTEAKAKAVRSIVEEKINLAKNPTLVNRRNLLAFFLHNKNTVNKLIEDLGPRYKETKSGYLKMYKTNPRLGDGAPTITLIFSKSKFFNNFDLVTDKSKNDENAKIETKKTDKKV